MSWQNYIDRDLVGTKMIHKAAILGLAGGVWAKSTGYEITPAEQTAIINGFKTPDAVQANGIRAQGRKFFTLQATPRSIYGKDKADGIIMVKTNQAVLVAEYAGPVQAGEATPIVEKLADYLISVQY